MNKRVNKTFTNSNQNLKENHNPGQNIPNDSQVAQLARKDSIKIGGGPSSAGVAEESH
jgi:hypothetical protein